MKIEPAKVVAALANMALPAEQGVEKGKEGLSFAKTMENIMGLLEKAEPPLSLAQSNDETATTDGEVTASFSPDIDLHTILLTTLGQVAATPVPNGHEIRTAHSATAYETAEVPTLAPTPTLSALPPAVNPVFLTPIATTVVESYPDEQGPLLPRDSIPPVRVEPMGAVTANPLPIRPLVTSFSAELKAPLPLDAPVALKAQVVSAEPPLAAVGELSKVTPQSSVEPTGLTTMPRLQTEMVSMAAHPTRPELTLAATPPFSALVSTKQNAPRVVLTPKASVAPSAHPSLDAQVFSAEQSLPAAALPAAALPAAALLTVQEPSTALPLLREYGQAMVTATPPEAREVYPPRARSSYSATDNLQFDMPGIAASLQGGAPSLITEPPAPTFMQRLKTEIISFAAHPTRPELTLEITPPEYGKVIVSAEQERGGQVVVRLITETPQAKTALLEHLPRSTPTLEVRVYTAEEYRDYRDERQKEQGRERQEQPARQSKREERVEFKI